MPYQVYKEGGDFGSQLKQFSDELGGTLPEISKMYEQYHMNKNYMNEVRDQTVQLLEGLRGNEVIANKLVNGKSIKSQEEYDNFINGEIEKIKSAEGKDGVTRAANSSIIRLGVLGRGSLPDDWVAREALAMHRTGGTQQYSTAGAMVDDNSNRKNMARKQEYEERLSMDSAKRDQSVRGYVTNIQKRISDEEFSQTPEQMRLDIMSDKRFNKADQDRLLKAVKPYENSYNRHNDGVKQEKYIKIADNMIANIIQVEDPLSLEPNDMYQVARKNNIPEDLARNIRDVAANRKKDFIEAQEALKGKSMSAEDIADMAIKLNNGDKIKALATVDSWAHKNDDEIDKYTAASKEGTSSSIEKSKNMLSVKRNSAKQHALARTIIMNTEVTAEENQFNKDTPYVAEQRAKQAMSLQDVLDAFGGKPFLLGNGISRDDEAKLNELGYSYNYDRKTKTPTVVNNTTGKVYTKDDIEAQLGNTMRPLGTKPLTDDVNAIIDMINGGN